MIDEFHAVPYYGNRFTIQFDCAHLLEVGTVH